MADPDGPEQRTADLWHEMERAFERQMADERRGDEERTEAKETDDGP